MKKNIILILLILFLLVLGLFMSNHRDIVTIWIDNKQYKVEVAKTSREQVRGLAGRNSLNNIDGMIFEYPDNTERIYWMNGMKFNLDFIWVNNGKIVGIDKNISYNDQEKKYFSPEACNQVIEFKAGAADENNIKIGDKVIIK